MSDVQLKKKVQLKQKNATPTVTLKRKGEATPVVTSVSDNAAVVATVATNAAAATAKAASTVTPSTGKVPPVAGDKPTAGVQTRGPATAATGANGADPNSSDGGNKTTGITNSSSSNKGNKKIGNAWAWILGVAAIAGLAFGGYKFANNNSKTPSNVVADNAASAEKNNGEEYKADESISQNGADKTGEDASTANTTECGAANGNNAQSPDESSRTSGGNASSTSGHDSTSGNIGNEIKSSSIMGDKSGENESASSSDGVDSSVTMKSPDANSTTSEYAVVKSVSESQAVCLFAFDSSIVGENDILNQLANLAKASDKKIEINAYADEVGADEYNQALSQRRANAVKDYFVKRGVKSVVISAKGNGETTQYATHAENRRADITIQ